MTKTIQSGSFVSLYKSEKDLTIEKNKKEMKKKSCNFALIIKLSSISIVCVLLAIIVFSIFSIHSMHTTGLKPAINIGINKLENDMAFFENRLSTEYGQLKLIDGDLIGQEGISLKNNNKLVDDLSADFNIAAAVFARNGNNYRRISTSIADNAGKRAVGTFLETDNAAYQHIQDGNSYTGKDAILGKNYLTEYRPIFAENGKEVIGILFVGMDMATIEKAVNANIVKYIKRMAVFTFAVLLAYITVSLIVCNIIRREFINEHNNK
jgi:methyl-accepting chemotaxis protein